MATMFPNELWMSIFEELDSPEDIAALVRTNKRFNSLAIKILYRDVVWSDPLKFARSRPFLQQDPSLLSLTRSLTLGISTSIPQSDRLEQISRASGVIFLTGDIAPINRPTRGHEARILDEAGVANSVDLLADILVTDAMYDHALTMTNLRDLTFDNMVLPDSFYAFVHRFPQLDRLVIENCTPPFHPQSTSLHPRDLPITELTIMGLRGRRDSRELRAFGEAQRLRVVRFDWTCYIYRHFWVPPPHNNTWAMIVDGVNLNAPPVQQPTAIPSHHNPVPSPYIHTIDIKFPTQKLWQSYVSEPHDHIILPFAEFLSKCPRVANLRVRNHLPWLRLSNTALPNLVYYQGPLTTIKPIVYGSRRLKHLTIRDPAGGLVALGKAFKEIEASGSGTGLESLSVFIGSWDDEILYAILHHFNGLKRLEVVYKEGDPSEVRPFFLVWCHR
ncbi:hypothetical protein JVU11DRAFT_8203 [Chiua virens]|nr:hypothetical protein JVU11DRAFT_8203 [Chiua virens]